MTSKAEDDFYQSEDDLDEDEATQYLIEQSLIQYRKLKRLNPRLKPFELPPLQLLPVGCGDVYVVLLHTWQRSETL